MGVSVLFVLVFFLRALALSLLIGGDKLRFLVIAHIDCHYRDDERRWRFLFVVLRSCAVLAFIVFPLYVLPFLVSAVSTFVVRC